MDFAEPANHREKIKETEKRDKYKDHARELGKLWNMMVMVIPFVIGVLGTALECVEKRLKELEIRRQTETIQTTALLRSARIQRRVLETQGNLLYPVSNERSSARAGVKNSQGVK